MRFISLPVNGLFIIIPPLYFAFAYHISFILGAKVIKLFELRKKTNFKVVNHSYFHSYYTFSDVECCTNFPPAVKKAEVLRIITKLIVDELIVDY